MITLTALRHDLYNKIDQVIATGIPIELERKGHIVKIIATDRPSKLSLFPPKEGIVGDPEDIIYNKWIKEWRDDLL